MEVQWLKLLLLVNWDVISLGGNICVGAKYQEYEVEEANSNCKANEIEWLLLNHGH